ncbi:MAG: AmmeMemoRadiSam system protein B [Bacteroidales bacterium]|nr:AmmeMemoRadiSam system protein B [Bacteroidales bacterium]
MKKTFIIPTTLVFLLALITCKNQTPDEPVVKTREVVDTIGFAQYGWQMDSVIARINRIQVKEIESPDQLPWFEPWKVCISPHDDYTYVGSLYPMVLENIKAPIILLFGVAHKARLLKLEGHIIFDNHTHWDAPYGKVKISALREEIQSELNSSLYEVNDSMHRMEHSVEALIPFLQYYNRQIEIIPVLVPYMSFDRMNDIADPLSKAIHNTMVKHELKWGDDIAIVISTDAVHYGNKNWGGKNYARYGTDSTGYTLAVKHELEIIHTTLTGKLEAGKIKKFTEYTVKEENYKEYKWTWCGRYAVPLGLLTAYYLENRVSGDNKIEGHFIGYSNSIDHGHIPVEDLGMGTTAPANMNHWVGYAAVGYY